MPKVPNYEGLGEFLLGRGQLVEVVRVTTSSGQIGFALLIDGWYDPDWLKGKFRDDMHREWQNLVDDACSVRTDKHAFSNPPDPEVGTGSWA